MPTELSERKRIRVVFIFHDVQVSAQPTPAGFEKPRAREYVLHHWLPLRRPRSLLSRKSSNSGGWKEKKNATISPTQFRLRHQTRNRHEGFLFSSELRAFFVLVSTCTVDRRQSWQNSCHTVSVKKEPSWRQKEDLGLFQKLRSSKLTEDAALEGVSERTEEMKLYWGISLRLEPNQVWILLSGILLDERH